MVAVDARGPKFDGGIVTRLDCTPFGIVVDRTGRRFHDEGAETGPRRFSIWGTLVARCPDAQAFAIFDAKAEKLFRPSLYPPIRAQTIADLAEKLALDPVALKATVDGYNRALRGGATEGLAPPKTHCALPLETPPFSATPMRPGVTFSYLGVKVDDSARVLMRDGRACANVFAAGAIMAANILGHGYLAGMGLTIGTVFGRIAGQNAARQAAAKNAGN
jgi:tricarballylate dehydrogenase